MKNKRRIVLAAVLAAFMLALMMIPGCIGMKKTSRTLADEERFWWHDEDSVSNYGVFTPDLAMFPVEAFSPDIKEYYYYDLPTLLDDDIQLFMRCAYSPENYEKECSRLRGASNYCHFETKLFEIDSAAKTLGQPVLNTDAFNYPAMVYCFEDGLWCEYALMNEAAHEVIYVLLQYIRPSAVGIPEEYLPCLSSGKTYLP